MSHNIEVIRHSLAHVLAAAIQKLWPDVKFAGGPAIENGFYYDFDMEHRITEEDFPKIEKEMKALIKSDGRFEHREVQLPEAMEIFKNEPYKLEWVKDKCGVWSVECGVGDNENRSSAKDSASIATTDTNSTLHTPHSTLSIYRFRDFTDLCRGPHVASSKELPKDAFKIRSVAGAYWKGDSKNKMLQRVYVDAFATAEELAAHLAMMEEAAKRDNRKLGRDMDLFHFEPDYAPGMVFWHDKGYKLYRKLIEFLRKRQEARGYFEISTPEVMDRCLWETSGHWAKYASKNFTGQTQDDRTFCVKPMSCPGGMLVYKNMQVSYKDLPMYVAEFGKVHRYEASGGLSGLMRVRGFTQDDAHIFCAEDNEQVIAEVIKTANFIKDTYDKLGFKDMWIKLATRPESEFRIGDDAVWDKMEDLLKKAAQQSGIPFDIAEGDAAFYGPKLDFYLKDALGREWQNGTIQMDMNLPERFDLSYINDKGEKERPIMLHRALIGSIERFIGVWLEHIGGNIPLWLSPEPVVVVPVSDKFNDYANQLTSDLREAGVYARADLRSETVPYKVRDLSLSKTPIIAIVGEKETADKTVTLRRLGVDKQETMPRDGFLDYIKAETQMPV